MVCHADNLITAIQIRTLFGQQRPVVRQSFLVEAPHSEVNPAARLPAVEQVATAVATETAVFAGRRAVRAERLVGVECNGVARELVEAKEERARNLAARAALASTDLSASQSVLRTCRRDEAYAVVPVVRRWKDGRIAYGATQAAAVDGDWFLGHF